MPEPARTASEAIAAANEKGRITRRPRKGDKDPSRRMEEHFLNQWDWVVESVPSLAPVRVLDNRHEPRGYLRATFFAPSAGRTYTEDEVHEFIDEFMKAVVRGLRPRPQQSAWKLFTGWWGRKPVATDAAAVAGEYFRLTGPADPA
jgi:hypothetical protein